MLRPGFSHSSSVKKIKLQFLKCFSPDFFQSSSVKNIK